MDTIESIDLAIAPLQDLVSSLQARIRALHIRRNALSPLCSFPDDIILYIIDILADCDQYDPMLVPFSFADSEDNKCDTPLGWGWPRIMGVCTRTRSLALQNTHLWTHINLNAHES